MSDASAAIPWASAALGCVVSLAVARFVTRPTSAMGHLSIGLLAFGLGILFIFVGFLLHGLCVQPLRLCQTHGDGNIGYAIGGFFAFPAYWAILAQCSRFEWESKTTKNRYMAAAAEAAEQYKAGQRSTVTCPKCHAAIGVMQHVADKGEKYLIISCSCGKCNTNFRLSPSEA